MNRYFCFLPLLALITDFIWWFQFAAEKGAIPEFSMLAVHLFGLFILGGLILIKVPNPTLGKLGLAWCVVFLAQSIHNFQQFGLGSLLASWLLPLLLFGLLVSPALVRSYAAIKNT